MRSVGFDVSTAVARTVARIAVPDLLGGHVQVAFDNVPNVVTQVKGGKLRALAITSPQRDPSLPDIPTVAEAGVPGYEVGVWFGIVAPAGTPQAIVDKLQQEISAIQDSPDVARQFAAEGAEAMRMSSAAWR